jgi:ribosomal protein S18 acetylase RimI-like enzyme
MHTQLATELHFEESDDLQALAALTNPIFAADIAQKQVALPANKTACFSKVAKTGDGRIAGGIVGIVAWNALRIGQLAANPDCRIPGTGTALMKCAEESARGVFECNQIYLATFSWQARPFYEKLGFKLQWTLDNHPQGFCKYFLAKVWSMEKRHEPAQGYEGAATDLVIEDWDSETAVVQITQWINRDTTARKIGVPPFAAVVRGLKVLHPDGSFAAACVFDKMYNTLFVFTLAVATDSQRRGVGSAVLRRLDQVARAEGCDFVLVATRSWEARPFFEKNGYEVAFTQSDHPVGFETHLLVHAVPPV